MTLPRALVVCGDGINCDAETTWALELAGFAASPIHTTAVLERPAILLDAQLLAIPGGFSFGDEIASGKVLAIKLKQKVSELLHQFVDQGKIVLGICNGFQVLVQLGFLPFSEPGAERVVSLARNAGGTFINRWVELVADHNAPGAFFDALDTISLPIRHGEGRLMLGAEAAPETIEAVKGSAGLRYKDDVNGSFERIAALTNRSGNVLGLMPHPEAFVRWTQHPNWGRPRAESKPAKGQAGGNGSDGQLPHGLAILRNAAKMLNG